jgi:hypothetical protein
VEISHENIAAKTMKSHEEISQRPKKSMKIPIGNPIRKMCSTKHELAEGLGKKRRQNSQAMQKKKTKEP